MSHFLNEKEQEILSKYRQSGYEAAMEQYKSQYPHVRKGIIARDIVAFDLLDKFKIVEEDYRTEVDNLVEDYPVDSIGEFVVRKYCPELKGKDRKNKRDLILKYIRRHFPQIKGYAIDFVDSLDTSLDELKKRNNGELLKQTINADGTMDSEKRDLIARDALEDFREKCKSEKFLLELHGYDAREFEITSFGSSIWEQGDSVKYSTRIKVKKRDVSFKDLFELTQELLNEGNKFPIVPAKNYPTIVGEDRNCAVMSIADLHLGRLSWGEETGENYDMKIARARFYYVINKAIERIKKEGNIEKIIFFWSQDFFNFDTTEGTTTKGTHLDTDIRWKKLFKLGVEMLVKAIVKFSEIAPVYTFYSRSNHDEMMGFYAVNYLYAWFRNDENISVNIGPEPRKYVRYGTNLLGFAHGDKEGKRIKNVMPVEAPEMWGKTTYREYFLGHVHHRFYYEEGGVVFRHLQTPVGTDAYEKESAFLGANKAAQLFIRNYYYGPVGEFDLVIPKNITSNVPPELYETK